MILKIKSFFFIVLITSLMQITCIKPMATNQQTAPANKMSMLNPATWICGLYAYIKPRVIWLTPSEAQEKIDDSNRRLINFLQVLFGDIIDTNHNLAQTIVKDADGFRITIDNTQNNVEGFKEIVIVQLQNLLRESISTEKTLSEIIGDLKKSSIKKFSLMHQKIDEFERRRNIADLLSQKQLEINKIKFSLFNDEIREQLNQFKVSRKKYNFIIENKIQERILQQQNHHESITQSVKTLQNDLKNANEECEKELEASNQNKKIQKELSIQIEHELLRLKKALNALSGNAPSHNKACQNKPQKPIRPKKSAIFVQSSIEQAFSNNGYGV